MHHFHSPSYHLIHTPVTNRSHFEAGLRPSVMPCIHIYGLLYHGKGHRPGFPHTILQLLGLSYCTTGPESPYFPSHSSTFLVLLLSLLCIYHFSTLLYSTRNPHCFCWASSIHLHFASPQRVGEPTWYCYGLASSHLSSPICVKGSKDMKRKKEKEDRIRVFNESPLISIMS